MVNLSNEEYVMQIQQGKKDLIEPLWQQNQGLIHVIVKKYISLAEADDLMQEAFLGFYKAIETFDTAANVLFSSYATTCVQRTLLRYLRGNKTVKIAEGQQNQVYQYLEFRKEFFNQVNREPTELEVCYYLNMSREQFINIQKAIVSEQVKSLDTPIGSEEETTLSDVIADQKNDFDNLIQKIDPGQMKNDLWQAVDSLEDMQAKVIHLRYEGNLTMKEVSNQLKIGESQTRTLEGKGIRKLRHSPVTKKLKPYYEDYLAAVAYHRTSLTSFRNTFTSSEEWHILRRERQGYL